jgi:hypothetical protein
MCISQKDLKDYQLIMAKMSQLDVLSEEDKKFLLDHNLKQKYDAYTIVLDVVNKLQ